MICLLENSFICSDIVQILIRAAIYPSRVCLVLKMLELHLIDVLTDLLSQKFLKLLPNAMLLRKLVCQLIGIITLLD